MLCFSPETGRAQTIGPESNQEPKTVSGSAPKVALAQRLPKPGTVLKTSRGSRCVRTVFFRENPQTGPFLTRRDTDYEKKNNLCGDWPDDGAGDGVPSHELSCRPNLFQPLSQQMRASLPLVRCRRQESWWAQSMQTRPGLLSGDLPLTDG